MSSTFGPDSIGNWDTSQLVRFLRDFQDQQPLTFMQKLRIDQLQVDSLLNLKPTAITLLTSTAYTVVGAQGAPGFENSWVAWGAGEAVPAYWKDPLGFIHLKGVIKSGTVGNTAFTLPPGYRPQEKMTFSTISNGALGRVDVTTGGAVQPVTPSNTAYVVLNGMYFRATI